MSKPHETVSYYLKNEVLWRKKFISKTTMEALSMPVCFMNPQHAVPLNMWKLAQVNSLHNL